MEHFSGLTWNVRGCNKITNRRNVKSHILQSNINFLCLQETKCKSWDIGMLNSLWNANTHKCIQAPSSGQSGGILTSWDTRNFQLIHHVITPNWILYKGITTNTHKQFICINVYAPQDPVAKSVIWDQFNNILTSNDDTPVCIMRDFNSAREDSDRINYQHNSVDSQVFNDFINNSDLIHIETQSPHYTWFGPNNKMIKLDWIFTNKSWFNLHSLEAKLLNRKNSYHKPIRLVATNINWGPKPFKFYNSWLQEQSLKEMLTNLKLNINPDNTNLRQSIKDIRLVGKWWNKNVFGNLDEAINQKGEELQKLDNDSTQDATSTKAELDALYRHRDLMIWQKSRKVWIARGDKNSRYFHQVVTNKRQMNNIIGISDTNQQIEKPAYIIDIFFDHFSTFLSCDQDKPTLKIHTLIVNTLPLGVKDSLERVFSVEEITLGLKESESNKSPSPDGLNERV